MEHRIIDLHVHSTESDGTLTPTEIVSAAKAAGLSAFALTDHDTAAGVSKAAPAAAACGIELIPGIELSTEYELPTRAGGGKEVHIVGLYIDPEHPLLIEKTNEFRRCRDARNEKIVAALQREGFSITTEALLAANPDSVITRANIARFLYDSHQIRSVSEAFEKYIGDGCKCYVGRFKVSPMEAVELIHAAGGIAVLAHPLLYHMSQTTLQHLIDELKRSPSRRHRSDLLNLHHRRGTVRQAACKKRTVFSSVEALTSTAPTNPQFRSGPDAGISTFPIPFLKPSKNTSAHKGRRKDCRIGNSQFALKR